jgi:hypothetical protein
VTLIGLLFSVILAASRLRREARQATSAFIRPSHQGTRDAVRPAAIGVNSGLRDVRRLEQAILFGLPAVQGATIGLIVAPTVNRWCGVAIFLTGVGVALLVHSLSIRISRVEQQMPFDEEVLLGSLPISSAVRAELSAAIISVAQADTFGRAARSWTLLVVLILTLGDAVVGAAVNALSLQAPATKTSASADFDEPMVS